MNKLIQSIVLTAVVFTPMSLISLVTSAAAHHNSSHVSIVATASTKTPKRKANKVKKPVTNGIEKSQPETTNKTQSSDTMSSDKSAPVTSAKSGKNAPKAKMPAAGTGLPSVPTGVPGTDMTKPSLPTKLPN